MNGQSTNDNAMVETPAEPLNSALVQLERQMERGSFFTHTALGENHIRLNEIEFFIYGLIDALMAKGIVSSNEVKEAAENVRQELISKGETVGNGVALRVEDDAAVERPAVEVDCAARMHICKSVCCKLDFALSREEVEAGNVKWDLGRPYFIRHEADGCCTHVKRETGGCNVYENRPAVCRGYSCANDERIWKDFDGMKLNEEWIAEHLQTDTRPRALRVLMHHVEDAPAIASGELPQEQSQRTGSLVND